ncbi:hypothetical protein RchiOBHm_Chr1g0333791 [Rosa chinensis]|uniref:Uncharacterized protein n=1 Tax=Rosa chinensis TaxID=74649 RepID=A0A2P6SC70_ROSCH|nr:hypothetical protein RchiOBHm_Chr1g0333791 [Rosa chinensis]
MISVLIWSTRSTSTLRSCFLIILNFDFILRHTKMMNHFYINLSVWMTAAPL